MANKKATCCICGSEYEVCHFCPEVANFTPWRRICDTSKHYQIYLILSEYNSGILNKADAAKQFEKIQVRPEDCVSFRPNVYKVIHEIFQAETTSQYAAAADNRTESDTKEQTEVSSTYFGEEDQEPKIRHRKKAKRS